MTHNIVGSEAEYSAHHRLFLNLVTQGPARKAGQVSSWWLVAAAILILAVVGRLA